MGVDGKITIARGVRLGANGSIYVSGYTSGGLARQPYMGGSQDVFIARYEDLGTQGNLISTRLLGTAGADLGYGITASLEGGNTFVYVTGQTNNAFPGSTNNGGSYDVFVAKLQADLTGAPVWLKQAGGSGTDYAYSITYANGTVSVAGASNTDLMSGADLGSSDMLTLTYQADGGFLFADHLGGPARETARAIAADENGNLFLAGSSDGTLCGEAFTGGVFDSMLVSFDNGCRISMFDPRCTVGNSGGDPHYMTFANLAYDFQGSGDFVLARVAGKPSFDVQARQCTTSPGSSVATFRNLGALVEGDKVELLSSGDIWVNGAQQTVSSLVRLPRGGALYRSSGYFVVAWPSGERLGARTYGSFMNIFLAVPKTRRGMMRGLFGDGDTSQDNEFMRRDGSVLRSMLSFQEMYRGPESLANEWRFNAATDTQLLVHGTDCTDLDAPHAYRSITTLTPAQRAMGEAACAGVAEPALRDDCSLDVGLTGDPALVAGANDVMDRLASVGQNTVPISKIRGVYFNNFTGEVGPEWDSIVTNVTPWGDRMLLGEFGSQNVQLTLNNLGSHSKLVLSFDLFIINAWTGDDGFFGAPTSWRAAVDGVEHINATFSNWGGTFQSYPASGVPAQTDALESGTLGYPYGDSVYRITLEFDHTAPNLTLDLSAEGLSGILGEAWGVANFEVQGR